MYINTANYLSNNNYATHDNEEIEIIESDELFSHQTINSACKFLNSGE